MVGERNGNMYLVVVIVVFLVVYRWVLFTMVLRNTCTCHLSLHPSSSSTAWKGRKRLQGGAFGFRPVGERLPRWWWDLDDACCDGGSTFRLKRFLNGGGSLNQNRQKQVIFFRVVFCLYS